MSRAFKFVVKHNYNDIFKDKIVSRLYMIGLVLSFIFYLYSFIYLKSTVCIAYFLDFCWFSNKTSIVRGPLFQKEYFLLTSCLWSLINIVYLVEKQNIYIHSIKCYQICLISNYRKVLNIKH